jgi:hypothetical protein
VHGHGAADGLHAVADASQTRPAADVCAAHAIVADLQPDWERRAPCQPAQRGAEPSLGEDSRVHATTQVTNIVKRAG